MIRIGHTHGEKMSPLRDKMMKYYYYLLFILLYRWLSRKICRNIMLFGGGVFNYKYELADVDYSKYLGPDWKPSYKGPSTIICNHSSWMVTRISF